MINVNLLKKICKVPGVSGFEQKIRALVIEEVSPLVDDVTTDAMGNVIAFKKGKMPKKAMVAAHIDEIGFIVTHVDDDGFVRFHTLGGFDPKTLTAQRVIIHGKKDIMGVMGCKPIHLMKADERGKPIVNSKSLDNRVSVFILIEVLRALKKKKVPYDIYGVFTVQEEVGLRGAISATHLIDPDFGFGLDTTIAFDVPGAQPHECDYRMVNYMKEIGTKNKIKWQPEILPAGGTDTAAIQRYGKNGAITGAISIPTRHIHQHIEMVHKKDVANCIELLRVSLTNLDTFDWSFK